MSKMAEEKGIYSKQEINQMDFQKRLKLIFESDISSKKEITSTSGRGIGMAAVKDYIDNIHGDIIVDSVPNKGALFKIKIPV